MNRNLKQKEMEITFFEWRLKTYVIKLEANMGLKFSKQVPQKICIIQPFLEKGITL